MIFIFCINLGERDQRSLLLIILSPQAKIFAYLNLIYQNIDQLTRYLNNIVPAKMKSKTSGSFFLMLHGSFVRNSQMVSDLVSEVDYLEK